MTEPEPSPQAREDRPSVFAAGFIGWLIPGAGHFYLGYNGRALLFFVSIVGLMLFGSALGDWKVIVPPDSGPETPGGPPRSGGAFTADAFWYLIHLGAGAITLFFTAFNKGLEAAVGTSSVVEIGHLYTRVGGALNVVLVVDACVRALYPPPALSESEAKPASASQGSTAGS